MSGRGIRKAAILIGCLDCLAAAWLAGIYFKGSDPATGGFDIAAAWITVLLVVLTAVPALGLSVAGRAPRTALGFALGFPAGFILLFAATAIAFLFLF